MQPKLLQGDEDGYAERLQLSEFGIECIAHPIPEKIDRQHQDGQRNTRENDDPPLTGKQKILADPYQRSQRRFRWWNAYTQKRQSGFGKNRDGQPDGCDNQYRTHHIGQDMAEHDDGAVATDKPR